MQIKSNPVSPKETIHILKYVMTLLSHMGKKSLILEMLWLRAQKFNIPWASSNTERVLDRDIYEVAFIVFYHIVQLYLQMYSMHI